MSLKFFQFVAATNEIVPAFKMTFSVTASNIQEICSNMKWYKIDDLTVLK